MNVHCHVQSHKFTCLVYTVKCVHPLHMCFCMLYCRVVQFCFKPRMSGSMCKSSNDVAGNWDDEKQRTTTQTSLDCFFERVDRKKKKPARNQNLCHRQAWVKLQLALHLLLLTILQLYTSHLHSPLQSVTLLACSLDASPVRQLLYHTTILLKVP